MTELAIPNLRFPEIAIINRSTVVSDADVAKAVAACQAQISNDFAPVWNQTALLIQMTDADVKANRVPPGWWQQIIGDDADAAGVLGYHQTDPANVPQGFVFAKTDATYGLSWTVTLSHELLEQIVDPWVAGVALKQTSETEATAIALEVADPVEDDAMGYLIDGVRVSNFVFPRYFQGWQAGGQFDFRGLLSAPLSIGPGGYLPTFANGTGWTNIESPAAPSARLTRQSPYQRTARRAARRVLHP